MTSRVLIRAEPYVKEDLIHAASGGIKEMVSMLLDQGADVNAISTMHYHGTALIAAVYKGNKNIVSLLLDRGADVNLNAKTNFRETALSMAMHMNKKDIVSMLLDRGADVNLNGSLETPLLEAVRKNNKDMVSMLLNRGANINTIITRGYYGTALIGAFMYGDMDIVTMLLDRGADVNLQAIVGSCGTALITAVHRNKKDIVSMLLDRGVNVNLQAIVGCWGTALITAVHRNKKDIVSMLLDRGADANAIATVGDYGTALIAAMEHDNTDMVSMLFHRGADVNLKAIVGQDGTVLIAAASKNIMHKFARVSMLLDRGADVNAIATMGKYRTALIAAVCEKDIDIARMLLDRGADVNAIANVGDYGTALIAAVCKHNRYIVSMLLDRGADANAIATVGYYGTALIAAIAHGNIDIVRMLLDRGADANVVVIVGDYGTALIAAMHNHHTAIALMLLDRGADVNIISSRYGTILGAMVSKRWYKHVIDKGADINAVGSDSGSELGKAAYEGDLELVSFLLSRGADPFHTGGKYNTGGHGYPTALDAARSGKAGPKLIELLRKVMAERSSTPGNEPSPPFPMPYVGHCALRQVLDEETPLPLVAPPSFESIINSATYGNPGLIAEHADLPCRSFKTDILINILVALVGINTQAAERLGGWIQNDVGYFVLQDYDLGLAYAAARVGWKNFNKPDFNVALHRAQWLKRAREIDEARNTAIVYHEDISTQQLIRQPYQVMPRRIWDIMSNRVVEFRMLHSEALASQDCASGFVSKHTIQDPATTVPAYWAITHSWTNTMASVSTSVNQYQWPVPLPPGLDLENHLRKELQLLGLETMYIWLDVLCLRQHATVDAMSRLREEEWEIDVPTIGNIYRAAEGIVRYFNGLGQPFVNEDWDNPRHWLKRAWTLQEIRTQQRTINGGVPSGYSHSIMDTYGTVKGRVTTLRRAIGPVLRLATAIESPGGCSIYELAREMAKRHATDDVDQVAGLLYLLRVTDLPIYDAKASAEEAWANCFNVLPLGRKNELLFDFPYRGTNQGWIPSWAQLLKWPVLSPEYDHTPSPSWEEPRPLEIVDLSLIRDKRAFFLSEIWGISQVHIRRESGRYDIYVDERPFGFYCPYLVQTPLGIVHDQLYTLANLEVGYANNWVVCEVIKKQNMNCKLRGEKATGNMHSSEVEVEVLRKIGVLRTDLGGELWLAGTKGGSALRKINALFV